jgi:hypothetical protein
MHHLILFKNRLDSKDCLKIELIVQNDIETRDSLIKIWLHFINHGLNKFEVISFLKIHTYRKSINLFTLIGMKIENFYLQYIAIWGIAAFPIIGTYLVETNPQLINKVSPVIAKIFTPLVFLNLFIYLVAVIYTGKYPTQDRNLLLVFNALLISSMNFNEFI